MLQFQSSSIVGPELDWGIDPIKKVEDAFITHAHMDHVRKGHHTYWASQETIDLIELRIGKSNIRHSRVIEPYKPFQYKNYTIEGYPTGHILGSLGYKVTDSNGHSSFVTGDIILGDRLGMPSADIPKVDTLITESTFADPQFKHPDGYAALKACLEEVPGKMLIGAYALGKAQYITMLLSKYFPELPIWIHPQIAMFNLYYQGKGLIEKSSWRSYHRKDWASAKSGVLICPPSIFNSTPRSSEYTKVFATGWKKLNPSWDRILEISDHADYFQLLDIVKASGAKEVISYHGTGQFLGEWCAKEQINHLHWE